MKEPSLSVCVINSDSSGCFTYRVLIPFGELKRYQVEYTAYPYLPNIPVHQSGGLNIPTWINFLGQYDLVIIQRCYVFEIAFAVRQVCDILGIPFVFETDDDYLNIPAGNPCHPEMAAPGQKEKFAHLLSLADYITVTNEELKRLYYRFNKNIVVFPNNVTDVHYFKDIGEYQLDEKSGKLQPFIRGNFVQVPAYATMDYGNQKRATARLVRIGYTTNNTHKADFETIRQPWFKALKELGSRVQVIYMGDPQEDGMGYFYRMHQKEVGGTVNCLSIPGMDYFMYQCNIRNFDIGIAPLQPDVFNMGKSPIKAVEYGSWGVAPLLPNFITYNREFTDGENCLMYYTKTQFHDQLMRLVEDAELRAKIGNGAREHVRTRRLEKLHSEARFKFYMSLVQSKRKLVRFYPDVAEANVNDQNKENAKQQPSVLAS